MAMANSFPLVIEYSSEIRDAIFHANRDVIIFFFLGKKHADYEAAVSSFRAVAKDFHQHILFVTIDSNVIHHDVMSHHSVAKDETKLIMMRFDNDYTEFIPDIMEFTESNIRTFVQGVLDGQIKHHFLSQAIPEDWNTTKVWELTGLTFDSTVFDQTKHVLVKFCKFIYLVETNRNPAFSTSFS